MKKTLDLNLAVYGSTIFILIRVYSWGPTPCGCSNVLNIKVLNYSKFSIIISQLNFALFPLSKSFSDLSCLPVMVHARLTIFGGIDGVPAHDIDSQIILLQTQPRITVNCHINTNHKWRTREEDTPWGGTPKITLVRTKIKFLLYFLYISQKTAIKNTQVPQKGVKNQTSCRTWSFFSPSVWGTAIWRRSRKRDSHQWWWMNVSSPPVKWWHRLESG